jgi:prepilin-type N-terminal cleavage/methylation domain-containing protein
VTRRRRRQRGVSLLEVLAAMTLFAIVAAGVAALAMQSMVRTVENKHATAAALIAQQTLEELRGLEYSQIVGGSSSVTMQGQAYDVNTGVASGVPADGMSHITVSVSWEGPEGSRSYAVETIYTDITGGS